MTETEQNIDFGNIHAISYIDSSYLLIPTKEIRFKMKKYKKSGTLTFQGQIFISKISVFL